MRVFWALSRNLNFFCLYDLMHIFGRLQHYAALSEDQLVIQIEDDGGGFPEEILQALREGKPIYKEDREHIGISNVVSRLKLYYGQEASITFENMESSGARVCIKLPRRNSNEITTC